MHQVHQCMAGIKKDPFQLRIGLMNQYQFMLHQKNQMNLSLILISIY